MVKFGIIALFPLVMGLFRTSACDVDWKLPADHFDGVNEHGVVSYWKQLGTIDLGENVRLPVNIGFQSDRDWSSPYLGQGWILPLLDSNIVQIDENNFRQLTPDGYVLYLQRDARNKSLMRGQRGWSGEIRGDFITLYATCGWKLVYKQGKLIEIVTPEKKEVNFIYANGRVTALESNGQTLLSVTSDSTSGVADGLTFNQKHYSLSLENKPTVKIIAGEKLINSVQPSLGKIVSPDGGKTAFHFAVDRNLNPSLDIFDRGMPRRTIVWNSTDRAIISDGSWTYNIAFPEKGGDAKIERQSATEKELWYYCGEKGYELINTADRSTTLKWFVSGPAIGRLRGISEMGPDGKLSVQKYSYDENGALLRYEDPQYEITVDAAKSLLGLRGPDGNIQNLPIADKDSVSVEPTTDNKELYLTYISKPGMVRHLYLPKNLPSDFGSIIKFVE